MAAVAARVVSLYSEPDCLEHLDVRRLSFIGLMFEQSHFFVLKYFLSTHHGVLLSMKQNTLPHMTHVSRQVTELNCFYCLISIQDCT